jgi:hypothetical protein
MLNSLVQFWGYQKIWRLNNFVISYLQGNLCSSAKCLKCGWKNRIWIKKNWPQFKCFLKICILFSNFVPFFFFFGFLTTVTILLSGIVWPNLKNSRVDYTFTHKCEFYTFLSEFSQFNTNWCEILNQKREFTFTQRNLELPYINFLSSLTSEFKVHSTWILIMLNHLWVEIIHKSLL